MNNIDHDNTRFVISHTLRILGAYSKAAENLLFLTISLQAKHTDPDNRNGLGLYKIDPVTHRRLWDDYLAFDPDLASIVRGLASQQVFLQDPHLELITNQAYATAIAWMIYQRSELTLPPADDVAQLTACWAKHFAWQTDQQPTKKAARQSSTPLFDGIPLRHPVFLQP